MTFESFLHHWLNLEYVTPHTEVLPQSNLCIQKIKTQNQEA